MEITLLPVPVDPPDSSVAADVPTSLVPVARGVIATRVSTRSNIVHSADTYDWSVPTGRGGAQRIYGTPVEDPQSHDASGEAGGSAWEYVSGWAWSPPIERTATAHYLMYAAIPKAGIGRLIDVYA